MKSNHPTVQWETQFQGPKQLGTQGLASHSRAKRTQDLGVLKLYNCDRAATIPVQGVPIHSSLALLQIHSIPGILCECINNGYYRHLFQRRSEPGDKLSHLLHNPCTNQLLLSPFPLASSKHTLLSSFTACFLIFFSSLLSPGCLLVETGE